MDALSLLESWIGRCRAAGEEEDRRHGDTVSGHISDRERGVRRAVRPAQGAVGPSSPNHGWVGLVIQELQEMDFVLWSGMHPASMQMQYEVTMF